MFNRNKKRIGLFGLILIIGFIGAGCTRKEASQPAESAVQSDSTQNQLYTCGMHPNVIQEGPGNCPICGMKLNPIGGTTGASETSTQSTPSGERKILYWRAPMDPTYISPKPGKSPMGMDLIPVYEGEEAFGATVKINPAVEQNIGVRIAPVERRDVYQKIRTIGRIDYDESKIAQVHTKISGWIEKTYINTTGQPVKKGEILLDIYSPQLVTAQEEYLDALENFKRIDASTPPALKRNLEGILASTKRRLEYFDISDRQIQQLEKTGQVRKTLSIASPFNGIVVEKHALDGMEVKPGMRLYTIADLSEIWVYADIYEYEVPWVKEGQKATMTLSYEPGKTYWGEVQYVYPYLEKKTRTVKVRLVFKNPNLELKPGMYANVDLETSPLKNVVAVPMEAVLFSGERNLVFVSLGGGRFAPRDVTVGVESGDGYYEIREGLKAGEKVVISAQFLLDSESKLQESISKMLSSRKSMSSEQGQEEDSKEMEPMEMPAEEGHNHNKDIPLENSDEMNGDMNMDMDMKMNMNMNMTPEEPAFGTVAEGKITYYTCPMESHAYVHVKTPGDCPQCGMKLVKKTEAFDAQKSYYTCPDPDHAYVIGDQPRKCPLDGQELRKLS